MTRHHEPDPGFDPRVANWLEGNPDNAPSQVLETVLAALPSIPQRRAIRLMRRPLIMNRFAYLAAAAATAAIAVVAVGAGGLLNAPAPSPVASLPVASPSPVSTKPLARNGVIAVTREGAIALIDPVTGKTVKTLPIGPEGAGDLTWAPDGRRLAFAATGGVWVMNVSDGTSEKILSCREGPDGCTIAWAPDGGRIAVVQGGQLELIDPDGRNRATVFVQDHPVDRGGLTQPTWSPDGSRIAFGAWISKAVKDGSGLYAVDSDGSDPTLILPVQGMGAFDAAWSPDGTTIAYIGSTDIRVCEEASATSCSDQLQLHVMSVALDGSAPRELHEAGTCYCLGFAPSLTWSPDGTSIAFVGLGGDSFPGGLTVMNADGTGLRQVTNDGNGPAWQPVP